MKSKMMILILTLLITISPAGGLLWAGEDQGILEINLTLNPDMYPKKFFGTMYPSYSIWVQDEETGKTVTLYVTKKLGHNKWIGAKARPSAGPVWEGVRAGESGFSADAISGATPKETQNLKWPVHAEFAGKKLSIYLEANCSFDYNDFYKEDAGKGDPGYTQVGGQPSLIWKGTFTVGEKGVIDLKPQLVGRGHVLGEDHKIDPDLSRITTAKEIFKQVEMKYVLH